MIQFILAMGTDRPNINFFFQCDHPYLPDPVYSQPTPLLRFLFKNRAFRSFLMITSGDASFLAMSAPLMIQYIINNQTGPVFVGGSLTESNEKGTT